MFLQSVLHIKVALLVVLSSLQISLLQEGFGLSSSPRLRGRGAGRDVILPEVRQPWTEVLPIQAIQRMPSY